MKIVVVMTSWQVIEISEKRPGEFMRDLQWVVYNLLSMIVQTFQGHVISIEKESEGMQDIVSGSNFCAWSNSL